MIKKKFTLQSAQNRVIKKDILLDVMDGDKLIKDYPVAWVKIRGSEDPVYLRNVTPILMEYKETVEGLQKELKGTESPEELKSLTNEITRLLTELMNSSVVEAICDWDKDFFGKRFSKKAAAQVFNDPANNEIYNQISEFMKDRESFLPTVSE